MDRILESLKNKRFVFWEEIARDGAQAKTILSAKQRIEIAKLHASLFGKHAPDHLVFAAGFISICKEEKEIIKELADNVDECYLAVNCRSIKEEIISSIETIKATKFPRVAFVLPVSERMCQLMLHKSIKEVLDIGIDIAKFALDKSQGIPIDVQLAASFDTEPSLIADMSAKLQDEGIAITHLGDTRGRLYPVEVQKYIKKLLDQSTKEQIYGIHFHNDLDFALLNNFECIKQGITLAATSWLGLAERNGLARTELMSFHLSYQKEKIRSRFDFDGENLFLSPPDLKLLKKIAVMVSEYTGVGLKVTDPIVGNGVNTISTGTPFVDPISFQPFDPKEILDIEQEILVTQLASSKVIKEIAIKKGYNLTNKQIDNILLTVKQLAYSMNRSILRSDEVIDLFEKYSN